MLRGASGEAAAALTERVRSVQTLQQAETMGEELFRVAVLVRSDPALRRVATDVALPAEVKQGVVRDLLGDKIGEESLDVVADAVGHRWTSPRDLADTLERLSEEALVRSVGARADQLVDELFQVAQTVQGEPELRDALANRSRSVEDRTALVDTILGGHALPATVTLVKHALAGSYRTVATALAAYRDVAANASGERVATVRVAEPLRDADRTRLQKALAKQYGQDVHINEVVDPSVLGGMRVELGDDVIDGTVAGRLDDARRHLVG